MPVFESLYAAGMAAVRRLAPSLASGPSKLGRGVRGRRIALGSLEAWAERHRDPDRALVWIHAPSVGEGLQARAVVEAVNARAPDRLQWVFTHFSPSAEPLARRMPVDWAGYLPWDVEADATRALAAARPQAIVFTKTEVWPVLSRTAATWGVPTALVAATLPPSSSRTGFPARPVLRPSMQRLALVAAIAADDGERFRALGVRAEALEVTGDPGVDSAATRAAAVDRDAPWLRPLLAGDRPTLVAGSTWPADEAVLLPALGRLRTRCPELRLVIAPHEPDDHHIPPLVDGLSRAGWSPVSLAAVERGEAPDPDAVVVDRVGVLAALYAAGTWAYVGGGFHDAGLHSVLEPAALGVPVLFGPAHDNARAARALLDTGGARLVDDSEGVEAVLGAWLDEPAEARAAGEAALGWIDRHRGAADRTASALLRLLPGEGP